MAQNINQNSPGLLREVIPKGIAPLPIEGEENVLITSALPYCNNVPHLGNIIGSTLSADVFSRYNRTRNRRTLYICGTDEYGTATETQALKEGITPRELCDKYSAIHRATYEWFELDFSYFGRTSTPLHTEISQDIYSHLRKNSLLEKQTKAQTYCEGCSKFLADRFVEGTCPNCGYDDARGDQCDGCSKTLDAIDLIKPRCLVNKTHIVGSRPSSHMYIKLDTIQPRAEEWIKKSWKAGKWSANSVINGDGAILDSRLKSGLRPSPVTRDLTWGVPVPEEGAEEDGVKGKVLYVWFDAPIGYPSITANFTPEWKQWWFNPKNVKLFQFMGKDNVYFHTVFFPSMLLGDGRDWTTLHHLSTTEFLNYEGGKFSKSRNLGVFGPAAKETGVPASVWRYYLISTRPESSDAMFSWAEFIAANNGVLLNNFGNFVNRTLKFVASRLDSVIPEGDEAGLLSPSDPLDGAFVTEINALLTTYIENLEAVKLRAGLQTIMQISARGNLYLQQSSLGKALQDSDPKRLAQVIQRSVNLIYLITALVFPFMPATSEAILKQLNAPARTVPDAFGIDILAGHHIGPVDYLFTKIEESKAEEWKARFGSTSNTPAASSSADPVATAAGPPVVSKRKAAAARKEAAKAADAPIVKTAEIVELEAKITAQGGKVRDLKAGKGAEGETLDDEVSKLLDLKKLLAEAIAAVPPAV